MYRSSSCVQLTERIRLQYYNITVFVLQYSNKIDFISMGKMGRKRGQSQTVGHSALCLPLEVISLIGVTGL